MIQIKNVVKKYQDKTILDNINIEIPTGGITAIVGPNGAGKSTLLSSIGRLLPLEQGQILVNNLDISTTKSHLLAQNISILRQENHFTTRLSVQELVGFGRYPYSKGRLTQLDHRKVQRALEFLELTELAKCFLDELSGGQRQRAYVAMVLCQDTQYILLDEPLNNLDMKHSVNMMMQIRRAADELQKTIVIVIHDINFAAAYANQIIALRQGGVVYNGSAAKIMDEQILEQIFDTPIKIGQLSGRKLAVYYRPDNGSDAP